MANLIESAEFGQTTYVVTPGEVRFASRNVERISSRELNAPRKPSFPSFAGFQAASRLDGQALAGTGALVFEGELLDR